MEPERVRLAADRWRTSRRGAAFVHIHGDSEQLRDVMELFGSKALDLEEIGKRLAKTHGSFSVVVQSKDFLFAAVDRVRSRPLFYTRGRTGICVSDSARHVQEATSDRSLDFDALLEMALAGYASRDRTAYSNVRQLRAGELIYEPETKDVTQHRYGDYRPAPDSTITRSDIVDALDVAVNAIFAELVERANGRPIVVPLSGGLDSRLVLAKLNQLDYAPLLAFSYGPPGNHEAAMAADVAEILGVDWTFYPSPGGRRARAAFSSSARQLYWRYSDGLSSIPVMTEFQGFLAARAAGRLPDDCIVINGQSGDFITGGHIPPSLATSRAPSEVDLYEAIIGKHYSLWAHLKTPTNLERVRELIASVLPTPATDGDGSQLCSLYESWEFEERQCKYVINQQRLYEYLNLDWELPLWDGRLIDLFEQVPVEEKFEQRAFLEYLSTVGDYKGVFSRFGRATWSWRPSFRWVVPVGRAVGAVRGADSKARWYARMRYFGSESNQFAMIGPRAYRSWTGDMRNPAAAFARIWFQENDFPWPSA
ncbi:MAG: hypothetical protein QOG04_973 [Actinomycetota bacterium]|jgi:asparagine synthase (glutamine-hydrolysing)|nr:hypothetical protein [Actinomycetota bacterium]